MTISREDIADHLDSQFSDFAASVGQSDDITIGYSADIDLTLRKLGKTRAELAEATLEESQEEAAFALAEYYAARRFWRQLSSRVNVKVDDSQFDYKQMQVSLKAVMEDAASICASLGYDTAASGWGVAWLNQDWIEAEPAEA